MIFNSQLEDNLRGLSSKNEKSHEACEKNLQCKREVQKKRIQKLTSSAINFLNGLKKSNNNICFLFPPKDTAPMKPRETIQKWRV